MISRKIFFQKPVSIFLAVLIFAVAAQLTLWHSYAIFDATFWRPRLENMAEDLAKRPLSFDIKDNAGEYRYSGHPGMSIVFVGGLIQLIHPSLKTESLPLSLVILNSFIIAALALTAYLLRPHSFWWIIVGTIFSFHPLYFYSTPTNSVTALLLTLSFFISLLAYERKQTTPKSLIFLLGFSLGTSFVTRTPTTVLIASPLLVFLYYHLRLQKTLLILTAAIIGALLFDPLLWFSFFDQLGLILFRTGYHVTHNYDYTLGLFEFVLFAPLSFISLALGSLLLITNKPRFIPFHPHFLGFTLFITALNTVVFLTSPWQSLRYFFPLFFIWDSLLPIFLIHLTKFFRFGFYRTCWQKTLSLTITTLTIAVLIFSHFYLLLYNFFIGFYRGLI